MDDLFHATENDIPTKFHLRVWTSRNVNAEHLDSDLINSQSSKQAIR